MKKRTREITALLVLLALAVGLVAIMAWYMRVGHNWTLAATMVDDIVGSMDRYSVVVYASSASHAGASSGAEGPGAPSAPRERALEAKGESLAGQVARSYRSKGASTIELHPDDLGRYDDPFCVTKSGRRIGIVFEEGPAASIKAWRSGKELREAGASLVVGIFANAPEAKGGVAGIDIAVFLDDGSVPGSGISSGSTFIVGNPPLGAVQAVLIPQGGVISAKVIEGL